MVSGASALQFAATISDGQDIPQAGWSPDLPGQCPGTFYVCAGVFELH